MVRVKGGMLRTHLLMLFSSVPTNIFPIFVRFCRKKACLFIEAQKRRLRFTTRVGEQQHGRFHSLAVQIGHVSFYSPNRKPPLTADLPRSKLLSFEHSSNRADRDTQLIRNLLDRQHLGFLLGHSSFILPANLTFCGMALTPLAIRVI